MFSALQPILSERSLHILMSDAKDGKIGIYIEPVRKDDKEDNAFSTPFRCVGTPEELSAELPQVLTQWLATRSTVVSSLTEALAIAEAAAKTAAEEAKKKAAERNKKPTPTAKTPTPGAKPAPKAAVVQSVTPSLLDSSESGGEDDDGDGGDASEATVTSDAATTADVAAPVAVEPVVAVDPVVAAAPAPATATETPTPPPAAAVAETPTPATAAETAAPAEAAKAVVMTSDPMNVELF